MLVTVGILNYFYFHVSAILIHDEFQFILHLECSPWTVLHISFKFRVRNSSYWTVSFSLFTDS